MDTKQEEKSSVTEIYLHQTCHIINISQGRLFIQVSLTERSCPTSASITSSARMRGCPQHSPSIPRRTSSWLPRKQQVKARVLQSLFLQSFCQIVRLGPLNMKQFASPSRSFSLERFGFYDKLHTFLQIFCDLVISHKMKLSKKRKDR